MENLLTNNQIRMGYIGAGGISRVHLEAASKLPDQVSMVSICDINEQAAKEKAEQFNIPNVYADYRRILESTEIDAVVVTLPNFLHSKVVAEALEAGKHVLCEKPMASNAVDARAMVEAQKKSKKKLMVSLNNRFRSEAQWLKQKISSDELGSIYYAKTGWVRRRGIPVWGAWFINQELSGGGPLIDIGVHTLDLTLWLMGYPKPVSVVGKTYAEFGPNQKGGWHGREFIPNAPFSVEDLAAAFIQLENGATIVLEASWASHIEKEETYVQLLGKDGGVRWRLDEDFKWFKEENGVPYDISPQFDKNDERLDLLKNFISSINNNHEPLSTAEQGLMISQILDAIYESSKTGKQVFID
jgi:predicted dehydrogenase